MKGFPFPRTSMVNLDNLAWYDAPLPRWWHWCFVQTFGFVDGTYVARCPCGAIMYGLGSKWRNKNERRKHKGK